MTASNLFFTKTVIPALFISLLLLWGCAPSGSGEDALGKSTVKGTITFPPSAASVPYSVFIDTDINGANGNAASFKATIEHEHATSIDYSISDVPAGKYLIYCLVDNDHSGSPNIGDFLGFFGGTGYNPPATANCDVPSDGGTVTFDFGAAEVVSAPKATVNGTVTLAADATGKPYSVIIDADYNGGNGYLEIANGTVSGSSIPYSITDVDAGVYYIYCLVDVDGSGAPSENDYFGYYGGTGIAYPAAPNCVIAFTGTVTFNFNAPLAVHPHP